MKDIKTPETKKNNAGIDKVKLILNPLFLNPAHPFYIRADNALTIHKNKEGNITYLAIHAEYFNPLFDYRMTIVNAIIEAINKKVFFFPISTDDFFSLFLTQAFIFQNICYFILGVSQVEFCFDFPEGKVAINKDAIKNGDIIQYRDKEDNLTNTYYTSDYEPEKKKSSYCVYNKKEKLIHDNKSRDEIEKMDVEYRIEARLNRENCPYLDIANLKGTYEDIFKRFQPFLAVLFYNHLYGHVDVKGKSNTHFTRLERSAMKGKTKYYNRQGLQKYKPIEKPFDDEIIIRGIKEGILEKYNETIQIANNHNEMPVDDSKDSKCSGKL